jgi:hypothetical protein
MDDDYVQTAAALREMALRDFGCLGSAPWPKAIRKSHSLIGRIALRLRHGRHKLTI